MCNRLVVILLLGLGATCLLNAQIHPTDTGENGGKKPSPEKTSVPITNADIIQMVQSNKQESAIVASIRSRSGNFDLSPGGCAALRQANVSQNLLNMMAGYPTVGAKQACSSIVGNGGLLAQSERSSIGGGASSNRSQSLLSNETPPVQLATLKPSGTTNARSPVTARQPDNQIQIQPTNRTAAPTPTHMAALGISTPFDPKLHGFRFVNDFQNDVVPSMDIRTGGLCGGMSYAALDYYFAHTPIPQQSYRPANRTTLQSYLYNREIDSLTSNLAKWAEVGLNPGGARNAEFFNWGLQGTKGGRLEELRGFLDRGVPAVIDLQGDGGTGNHQVVAIGYSMGRYLGDLGNFEGDLKISVYDPNYPLQIRTLLPDVSNQLYRYAEGGSERWRTYFVDTHYHAKNPPSLPSAVYPNDGTARELILSFHTGPDDLRGGNDNIDLTLDLLDGTHQFYPNINLGARWIPNYTENARVVLSHPVRPEELRDLTITDTFGGGINGDNWDMSSVDVYALVNGKLALLKSFGFHRFSADSDGAKARSLTLALK